MKLNMFLALDKIVIKFRLKQNLKTFLVLFFRVSLKNVIYLCIPYI